MPPRVRRLTATSLKFGSRSNVDAKFLCVKEALPTERLPWARGSPFQLLYSVSSFFLVLPITWGICSSLDSQPKQLQQMGLWDSFGSVKRQMRYPHGQRTSSIDLHGEDTKTAVAC